MKLFQPTQASSPRKSNEYFYFPLVGSLSIENPRNPRTWNAAESGFLTRIIYPSMTDIPLNTDKPTTFIYEVKLTPDQKNKLHKSSEEGKNTLKGKIGISKHQIRKLISVKENQLTEISNPRFHNHSSAPTHQDSKTLACRVVTG